MTLHIDPEFRALIPPLTPDERQQLEANLLKDGCRDALVVWNGVLLDGHTRHDICMAHHIKYRTVEQSCTDRDDAKRWILQHQLGRRNLNDYQRSELVLRLEPLLSAQAKERQASVLKRGNESPLSSIEDNGGRTYEQLAQLAGVSKMAMQRSIAVKKHGSPELQAQVRNNEVSLSHAAKEVWAGRTGPIEPLKAPQLLRRKSEAAGAGPTTPSPAHRKEERTLAGRLAALLAELRRQRKENHDDLRARRWVPDAIVKRYQTQQLNWIEGELEQLVQTLRDATPSPSPTRATPARSTAS